MKTFSYYINYFFGMLALAFLLPALFQYVFIKPIEKTHLFHSVLLDKFIYTETVPYPKQAQKTEDHHDSIAYQDQDGNFYTRLEFEDALPFIYYRNAEVRGKLPLVVNGISYTRSDIEKQRRVIELLSRNLHDKNNDEGIYPLFEAKINQVALTFPDYRLRFNERGAEFISADTNNIMKEKSLLFTKALQESGVRFPVLLTAGNYTTFKPFEFGMLLVDVNNNVFHLKQFDGKPQIERLDFPKNKKLRHVVISENRDSSYLGLAVDRDNGVYLLKNNPIAFIPLETPFYNADVMDLKILFDPIEITAVYSDEKTIFANTYSYDYKMKKSYEREMSRAWQTLPKEIYAALFPFAVQLEHEHTKFAYPELCLHAVDSHGKFNWLLLLVNILFAAMYYGVTVKHKQKMETDKLCLIFLFGIFALIPALFLNRYH